MKKLICTLVFALLAVFASPPADAAFVGRGVTFANLQVCDATRENYVDLVVDADAVDDLGNGGGAFKVWVLCASSAWSIIAPADTLANYAPLASPSFTGTVELPANVSSGGGTAFDTAGDTTYFTFNATGGGGVLFLVPPGIPSGATLPACDGSLIPAGSAGLAYDTTGPDLCICNGTSWSPVDGTGTCA